LPDGHAANVTIWRITLHGQPHKAATRCGKNGRRPQSVLEKTGRHDRVRESADLARAGAAVVAGTSLKPPNPTAPIARGIAATVSITPPIVITSRLPVESATFLLKSTAAKLAPGHLGLSPRGFSPVQPATLRPEGCSLQRLWRTRTVRAFDAVAPSKARRAAVLKTQNHQFCVGTLDRWRTTPSAPIRSGYLPDTEQLCGILYETLQRWLTNEQVCYLAHNYAAAQRPHFGRFGRRCMKVIDRMAATDRALGDRWAGGDWATVQGASQSGRSPGGRSGISCRLA